MGYNSTDRRAGARPVPTEPATQSKGRRTVRKVLTFFLLAFLLYFVITNPAGFTDAVTDIADFFRTVFNNVAEALNALFN